MCLWRLKFRLQEKLQNWQTKCFSPVWVTIWSRCVRADVDTFGQYGQIQEEVGPSLTGRFWKYQEWKITKSFGRNSRFIYNQRHFLVKMHDFYFYSTKHSKLATLERKIHKLRDLRSLIGNFEFGFSTKCGNLAILREINFGWF